LVDSPDVADKFSGLL